MEPSLDRCPFCHDPVHADTAREACGVCAAVFHERCWSEGGGCLVCPRQPAPTRGCRVHECPAEPLPSGLCPRHAREHALYVAGVFTLLSGIAAVPGVLLLLSEARSAGVVLLLCAALAAAGRVHYARAAERL